MLAAGSFALHACFWPPLAWAADGACTACGGARDGGVGCASSVGLDPLVASVAASVAAAVFSRGLGASPFGRWVADDSPGGGGEDGGGGGGRGGGGCEGGEAKGSAAPSCKHAHGLVHQSWQAAWPPGSRSKQMSLRPPHACSQQRERLHSA
eukprot:3204466-Prymnesium_polylepis.2